MLSYLYKCRYAYFIKYNDIIFGDDNETVVEIRVEYDSEKKIKLKVFFYFYIYWCCNLLFVFNFE